MASQPTIGSSYNQLWLLISKENKQRVKFKGKELKAVAETDPIEGGVPNKYEVELLGGVSQDKRHVVTSKCDLLLMSFFNLQESESGLN